MEFCQKKESEMFDLAADYYDRYRPSYPLEIIQSLVEYANVTKDSNLLEIGAGSGKATELLEGYGCKIHCVEVGEHLVERGKEKFAKNPNISFECGRFEELKIQEHLQYLFLQLSFLRNSLLHQLHIIQLLLL